MRITQCAMVMFIHEMIHIAIVPELHIITLNRKIVKQNLTGIVRIAAISGSV